MAAALVEGLRTPVGSKHPIGEVALKPSGGGVFNVLADGDVVFSKQATGRFPSTDEVLTSLRARLA